MIALHDTIQTEVSNAIQRTTFMFRTWQQSGSVGLLPLATVTCSPHYITVNAFATVAPSMHCDTQHGTAIRSVCDTIHQIQLLPHSYNTITFA